MNHQHNSSQPTPSRASQSTPSPTALRREPYVTPRLTHYGRFQHITGVTNTAVAQDEAIFDEGLID